MNATRRLDHELRSVLADAGLHGSFLVRDLHTGEEIGLDPDREYPVASLVKVPLALATLDRIHRGELDGATMILVPPGRVDTPGPTGVTRFRHPAHIALDDLLYLAVSISDNSAADALFALTPPPQVLDTLHRLGVRGLTVRHPMSVLSDTLVEQLSPGQADVAHELAIRAGTDGRGHRIPQLDLARANTGTARAFADLLEAIWHPTRLAEPVGRRLRELLAANVHRQRLAPDFTSDASTWSSKTGTLLNLRHETGVVEHADGQRYAVVVLTESTVPAVNQTAAEAAMAHVARALRDRLRSVG